MKAIRSHYLSRRICLALAMLMLATVAPLGTGMAFAQDQKTVLVFPVAVAAEGVPGDAGQRSLGALTMAIDDTPGMDALQFSPTSPSVRRAVSEGRVRQVDVEEGTADLGTALSIGRALGADYIVMSAIQSFTRKSDPTSVELILAGQMYDVAANTNPATAEPIAEPKVLRAFGVSGASAPRARYTGSEAVLVQEAIRNAASKAAATLSGRTDVVEIAKSKKSTKKGYKYVLLGALLVGLLVAVNSGNSGGDTGANPNALPVTNVRVQDLDGTIRLSWQEPTGTTLAVQRYRIERAVNGGSFTRIDRNSVGSGRTFFNDSDLLTNLNTYQYRIYVIYTSGAVSPPAISAAIDAEG